jgi:tetratricopeptide (TPR) repeat protein
MNKAIENTKIVALLAEEMSKRRLQVFVGAGCSKAAGLPSWKEMIDEIAKECNIRTKDTDLIRLASRLEKEVGVLKFREKVIEKLVTHPDVSTSLLDLLVSLDVNTFITTNYDHLLETSFARGGYAPRVISDDRDLPSIDPTQKTVVKLHGDINSPSSLVINSRDYISYSSNHRAFVEWLNVNAAQNTILFIGSSFEDPRLKSADEHVLNLFSGFRREAFIFLKTPESVGKDQIDYEVEVSDFDALCENFKERGVSVIRVESYKDIEEILHDVYLKCLEIRKEREPSNLQIKLLMQSEHMERTGKDLTKLLHEKTDGLCESVISAMRASNSEQLSKSLSKLIEYLESPGAKIPDDALIKGLFTAIDGLLENSTDTSLNKAELYCNKLSSSIQESKIRDKWLENLRRAKAKILFFRGKTNEALTLLEDSKDNKTISLWIAILIDSGQHDKVAEYLPKVKLTPEWAAGAIYALINAGEISRAEDIYSHIINDNLVGDTKFDAKSSEGINLLKQSHILMAEGLFQRAIRLSGKQITYRYLPTEMTQDGEKLCKNALKCLETLFRLCPRETLVSDSQIRGAVLREMSISFVLGLLNRSDKLAKLLIGVKPLMRDIVSYVTIRIDSFSSEFLRQVRERLEKEHPDQGWAWNEIAFLDWTLTHDLDKSWNALQKAIELTVDLQETKSIVNRMMLIGSEGGHIDKAMNVLAKVLPSEDHFRRILEARFSIGKKDFQKANQIISQLEKETLEVNIQSELLELKADLSIRNGRWDEAKPLLEKSYSLWPEIRALNNLIVVLYNLGEHSEVIRIAEKIESMGYKSKTVLACKAQSTKNLGMFDKSQNAWLELVKQAPDNPEFSFGLGDLYYQMEEYDKALSCLKKFVENN